MAATAAKVKVRSSAQCRRCGGLMVRERFYDWMSDTGRLDFEGVRCLVCGEIIDPIIISHRSEKPEPVSRHRYYRWDYPMRQH